MSLCRIVELTDQSISGYAQATSEVQGRGRRRVDPHFARAVERILESVRKTGWKAAIRLTRKFDAPRLKAERFAVSEKELREAVLPRHQHDAILKSMERVTAFHERQLRALTQGWKETRLAFDVRAWEWRMPASEGPEAGFEGQRLIPIERVGVYVPGGKASYPSSVIMNSVPAKVAGVSELMICTPPRPDGTISPAVLVAARELGIETVVKCGGAQAIALMAFGPYGEAEANDIFEWGAVDKIVGPGNVWVNEAKRQLWGQVGLDTFAGPSEVCVVADETADPALAAADWLTQVEHAEDNVGLLLASSRSVAERILEEAERQLQGARREAIMRAALQSHGLLAIQPPGSSRSPILASAFAAEHTSLMTKDEDEAAGYLRNAGCLLLGDFTPQSAGDFCSWPSHTLPTGGAARFGSPVNVMDFLKFQSISRLSREDLADLLPTIEAFGEMEGFPQHAAAARMRF
jgi:histidinol dehydrogenase